MGLNITDKDIEEAVEKWLKEQERKRWKDDKKHNDFLNYLIELVRKQRAVDDWDYEYNDDPIKPDYTGEEFSELLTSLFDLIDDYAKEHNICNEFDIQENDYFAQDKYCVKINNEFYSIKLVVGQGSFVRFEKIEDNKGCEYIDYKDISIK